MEKVSMNDIPWEDNSPKQPFEPESEEGYEGDPEFRLKVALKLLEPFVSDEAGLLKAILADAFLLQSSAAIDIGAVLRLCFKVFCESRNDGAKEPEWRFSAGDQYRIQNVQYALRPRFQFLKSIVEHILCCLDDRTGSSWGDIVAGPEPSGANVTICLKTRDQNQDDGAGVQQPPTQWTLVAAMLGDLR